MKAKVDVLTLSMDECRDLNMHSHVPSELNLHLDLISCSS